MPNIEIYCRRKDCIYNDSNCFNCDEGYCISCSLDIGVVGNCRSYEQDLHKLTKCSECEELSQYE